MPPLTKSDAFNVRVDPLLKREVVALTEALGGTPSAIITRALIELVETRRAELAVGLPGEKRKLADLTGLFLKATNENKDALTLADFTAEDVAFSFGRANAATANACSGEFAVKTRSIL